MKELTNAIDDVKYQNTYEIEEFPQMSRIEIDEVLQLTFLKSKIIEIQTNEYDDQDRHLPSIVGKFRGRQMKPICIWKMIGLCGQILEM